ncbi:MAG TPA: LEPR-XLL domain-containing protein, partial [Deltaproteobacteria bacterium]|nr:LEPR-XLL domain-containing protein [Deltaproteobacteria bacterium]
MGNLGRFRRRKRRPINYYRRGYDRVHFESLEPRLLLDSITADAEAAIIGGLESFKDWAATLDTYADMAKRLPLVNMGLSDIADVSEIAEEEIYNVVQDYFGSHAEPTTEELTAYLAGLSEYTGVVDSSDSSKYLFEVNFHGERTDTTQLDLTDQSALEYLDIDSPIDLSLTGSMDLDFSFGYDITNSRFFLQFDSLNLNATAEASGINVSAELGFLNVSIN